MPPRSTELEWAERRFAEVMLSKATKNGDCLECHYKSRSNGYAQLRDGDKAHRFIWKAIKGPIPDGLWVLHSCDNRLCINIDHLFLGTRQDNINDMIAKGRNKNCKRSRLITEADYYELLELRRKGASYSELASRYGVNKTTIYKYATGQRRY